MTTLAEVDSLQEIIDTEEGLVIAPGSGNAASHDVNQSRHQLLVSTVQTYHSVVCKDRVHDHSVLVDESRSLDSSFVNRGSLPTAKPKLDMVEESSVPKHSLALHPSRAAADL